MHNCCKPCRRLRASRDKSWLSESYKLAKLKRKVVIRRWMLEYYKLAGGCSVCGESRPECLEANHRVPALKKYNIGNMVSKCMSIELIAEELKKCDIVCANCHCMITARQFGWYVKTNELEALDQEAENG